MRSREVFYSGCWQSPGATGRAASPRGGKGDPFRKRRLDAFYRQIEHTRYLEICPRSAFVRLTREGIGGEVSPHAPLPLERRLEQLENAIALINSFDNYELALASEAEEQCYLPTHSWQVTWDSRGGCSALIEVRPDSGDREHSIGLEAQHTAVCRALRDHFIGLFETQLSGTSRDKRDTLRFLEAEADWVRAQTVNGASAATETRRRK